MQNATPTPDAREARTLSLGQSIALFIGKYGALIVLALLFVVFSIIAPYFLTWANIVQIFNQAALGAIAACGLTMVLASNQFDLSIGNTASLAGIVVCRPLINGVPIPVAIVVALLVGVVVGLTNAFLVTRLGVNALVATLGVGGVAVGINYYISGGAAQPIGVVAPEFSLISVGTWLTVPRNVYYMAAIVATLWVLLNRTVLGRDIQAVGGNAEAARLAGVGVKSVTGAAFIICAVCAAITGILLASVIGSGQPTGGDGSRCPRSRPRSWDGRAARGPVPHRRDTRRCPDRGGRLQRARAGGRALLRAVPLPGPPAHRGRLVQHRREADLEVRLTLGAEIRPGGRHDRRSGAAEISELLGDAPPSNWGKWGPDDEVGSLNYLTRDEVLRGVASVRTGEVFTLQVQIGSHRSDADPVWPNRTSAGAHTGHGRGLLDERGGAPETPSGHHYADDRIDMFLQGSTQYDALGHLWYDGRIWNGYDAATTVGSLEKASVLPIAERGVVGRGVLIDMARHRGKRSLDRAETFTHVDLLDAARAQGCEIEPRDILLVRTGWIGRFYEVPRASSTPTGTNRASLTAASSSSGSRRWRSRTW